MTLSAEQTTVVHLPVDSHTLVIAGPGTGKTHTLIHRLAHLVATVGLSPRAEVLVLSFSRAAVAEIRTRLVRLDTSVRDDDLRFVNVRTFDSFATRLLTSSDEKLDLSGLDYDARIQLAIRTFSDPHSEAASRLASVRHVIVDEIQDLVGARARLVQSILGATNSGFTLLGDPAQAIFDYLVERPEDGPTSQEFLSWLRHTYHSALDEYSLGENFRAVSSSAQIASTVRTLVLSDAESGGSAYRALLQVMDDLPSAGSVEQPDETVLRRTSGTAAVLCRTNADVHFTASHLARIGITCTVPPLGSERGLPPWIGRIFGAYSKPRIDRTVFTQRWMDLVGAKYPPGSDMAWNLLKAIEGTERAFLDMELVRDRLRRGVDWSMDSDAHISSQGVTVTTVHQAKGREYDVVAILPPESMQVSRNEKTAVDEARVLYVAATRSKQSIYRLDRHGLPAMYEQRMPSKRPRRLGQDRFGVRYFEAGLPGDIVEDSFVDRSLVQNDDVAQKLQELIWQKLKPGHQMALVTQKYKDDIRVLLSWQNPATEKYVGLGLLDADFKVDLATFLGNFTTTDVIRYQGVYAGLAVVERRTVILPPYAADLCEPFVSSGFCLGISVRGLMIIKN